MTTSDEPEVYFSDVDSTGPVPADAGLIFACSSSSREGSGSVAIASEAVCLGENDGVFLVETCEIRAWHTESRGNLFALTVVSDREYVLLLVAELRTAVVGALTRNVGPERKGTLDT